MLVMLFLHSMGDSYDATWGVVIFITLAMCSTSVAFNCILIKQLHTTSQNQNQPLLGKHMRFWIATMCVSITVATWCCIWLFTAIYYKYDYHWDPDLGYYIGEYIRIRIWPTMPLDVENWIKLMMGTIPAIGFAIAYLPINLKQMQAIKPVFPPSRSQWFPSFGLDGVKWANIAAKLGWIAALSAVFIPIFITYSVFRGYDPVGSFIFPYMVSGIVAASISVGGHGFAAVVAGVKSQFKFARAFIEMYREQAGLPPLPDGYRLPPGLLTRPAFFSTQEGDMNPGSYMGYRSRDARMYGSMRGPMEDPMGGSTGYPVGGDVRGSAGPAMRDPYDPRSWYVPPQEGDANANPGMPVGTIDAPTPQARSPSTQARPTPGGNQMSAQSSIPRPPMAASPAASNPEPPAPKGDAPVVTETEPSGAEGAPAERKPPAPKAPAGSDELKLDFTDID
jgi:hypothetical protein